MKNYIDNNLKKGLIIVLLANIVNLIFNLLTNFLLPKYLSVDSYAAIKTFQLYTTYIGIFGLGAADGMYLHYGGNELKNIDTYELKSRIYSFRILMLLESIIIVPTSFLLKDRIIIAFSFTIFTMNMIGYFKNLYQAAGEFNRYGRILNWTTIATFLVNVILLFIIKTDMYLLYLTGYILIDTAIWIALEYDFHMLLNDSIINNKNYFSFKSLINDIKSGFLLTIGNFSNILLSSMDRWFVKLIMDSSQFAYYSFAVSMEGFINIAITPITTTLYNYFCNHLEENDVIQVRRYVMLLGTVIVAMAFPAKFIIEMFLKNYVESIHVLFILFATQTLYIMIKGVYINLYKAKKKQNLYFVRLILIIIIGAVLNVFFVYIYPFKEAFSVGTLLSGFIWLIFSNLDFKQYRFEIREWAYIIVEIVLFILCGFLFNSIIGLILYIIATLIMMFLFMKNEVHDIFIMMHNLNLRKH